MITVTSNVVPVRARVQLRANRSVVARAGFKDSVAGKSNWNAYEGSDDKALTPEELKAKNEAEEKASQARRAEAAKRMAAEREAVGYDPLRSGMKE